MPRGRGGCPHALGSDARHARRTRRSRGRRRDALRHLARLVAIGPVAVCGVRDRGTWPRRRRMSPAATVLLMGVAAAASSAVLIGLVRRALIRRGILDRPNERSSHAVPTPRGGGLGLLPVLFIAWLALEALLPPMAGDRKQGG